jgi:hypothetical protein
MAYTRHGHHIPGTIEGDITVEGIARCGGVKICPSCKSEAEVATRGTTSRNDECRLDFTKHVTLRMRGDDVGEAKIWIDHGEIFISANIDPSSRLGSKLLGSGDSFSLD